MSQFFGRLLAQVCCLCSLCALRLLVTYEVGMASRRRKGKDNAAKRRRVRRTKRQLLYSRAAEMQKFVIALLIALFYFRVCAIWTIVSGRYMPISGSSLGLHPVMIRAAGRVVCYQRDIRVQHISAAYQPPFRAISVSNVGEGKNATLRITSIFASIPIPITYSRVLRPNPRALLSRSLYPPAQRNHH